MYDISQFLPYEFEVLQYIFINDNDVNDSNERINVVCVSHTEYCSRHRRHACCVHAFVEDENACKAKIIVMGLAT